ncbi:MAG TPA: glycosyltransferase family 2 protein [Candidatus Paceibacterota bacterium]|nr:glycosyltransferase family 2 protein [Candidatus Paceibacterota bacterium]
MNPKISITVLSYRNPALLRLCLKSLASALAGHRDYEVVVVDNATSPETRNVLQEPFIAELAAVRLVPLTENTGYTRGVNEGFRASRGRFLCALNYDIVARPGAVHELARFLAANPSVGLAGPRLVNFDGSDQDSSFRFYRPFTVLARRMSFLPGARTESERFVVRNRGTEPMDVDWVSGAAFMTTRDAADAVGLLDERLFHYLSDVDWAHRFWENGYRVVHVPSASLLHYLGRSSKGRYGILDPLFNRATRWHLADAWRYFRKHGIRGDRPVLRTS